MRRATLVLTLCLVPGWAACERENVPPADAHEQAGEGDGDGDQSSADGDEPGDGDGDDDGESPGDGDQPSVDAGTGACAMVPEQTGTGEVVGSLEGLIPKPAMLSPGEGTFGLTSTSAIVVRSEALSPAASLLREQLARGTGYALPLVSGEQESCVAEATLVVFEADPSLESDEAYTLEVASERVHVRARALAGALHASQTLRQLFPADIERESSELKARWSVPNLTIRDAPRFRYRGLHLDVSRHFWSLTFVKRYIDLLAAYKLNTFHFHLTDDQGFRIEIKKYPRLTEIGAYRDDGTGKSGGFYTQDEIREIVRYAEARGVTVIPEIEMPGHASAALAAYPEYGCTGQALTVPTTWGIFENLFCPTEQTFAFLGDVLDEVFALFPSRYVHIGGDEVPKRQWQESADAQAVIRREGLADEEALQAYFVRRIEQFARGRGRTVIGWDEIVADGVPTSATIMAWRGVTEGKDAAERGYDVIMTPHASLYFDQYQADPAHEPKAIGGFIPVASVYAFDPLPAGISEAGAAHVLGGQGNLWTEYIETESYAEYMAFPRVMAMAEVLWSPREGRDYDDFVRRLSAHVPHLDAQGVNYARHALPASRRTR